MTWLVGKTLNCVRCHPTLAIDFLSRSTMWHLNGPKTQNMVVFLRFVLNDGVLSSLAKHAKIVEEHAIHTTLSFATHESAFNAYEA